MDYERTKKSLVILLCVIWFSPEVFSQKKEVSYTNQQWFQYFGQIKLAKKWQLLPDVSYRWRNQFAQRTQYLVRAGVGYWLNAQTQLVTGVGHLGYFGANTALQQVEYRPYQDLIIRKKWGRTGILQRYRLEERFFVRFAQGNTPTHQTFNLRFRYRFAFGIPLLRHLSKQKYFAISLHLAEEILLNAGPDIVSNVFDQNRLQIGAVFRLDKNLRLSLIYSQHFVGANVPGKFRVDEIYWMGLKQVF